MIQINLPDCRTSCGTLRMLGIKGDVVFGPVPVAASASVPIGNFQTSVVSETLLTILIQATPAIAIQSHLAESHDLFAPNRDCLRIGHRDMLVLVFLIGTYQQLVPCTISTGPAISIVSKPADEAQRQLDAAALRRLLLAYQIRCNLRAS